MNANDDLLEEISLRPIAIADYKAILNWSKDAVFCEANDWEIDRDAAELYQWWQHCVTNEAKDFIRVGIEYDQQLVGYADLADIKNNSAELGIALGERRLWGKGLGTYAAKRMMEYATIRWGITVFDAETHEANVRSINMLKKIGFKETSRKGAESYRGTISSLIQYRYVL